MVKPDRPGRKVSDARRKRELGRLQPAMLQAHFALKSEPVALLVIVVGLDGTGKGDVIERLVEWLDPRGVDVHAFWRPTEDETERPTPWRYWRALPARGRVAVHLGSWYTEPLQARLAKRIGRRDFEAELGRLADLETALALDGTRTLKILLDLSQDELRSRHRGAARDPETHWQLFSAGRHPGRAHRRFGRAARSLLRISGTPEAPWHVVDAGDADDRDLRVARLVLDALRETASGQARGRALRTARAPAATRKGPASPGRPRLPAPPAGRRLASEAYETALSHWQGNLGRLAWKLADSRRACLVVFEGWDAAGKGGAILRLVRALDPRMYQVTGFAAPTPDERAHHYLWRFWQRVPRQGYLAVFDRSHYGRVLVERVEGFATPAEWQRAYGEITAFERCLTEAGVVVIKLWLHVSRAEQLRRFRDRQETPGKQYKITADDWRNRRRWTQYEVAVADMLRHTSVPSSPWTVVASDDKRWARIHVLETVCRRLQDALD